MADKKITDLTVLTTADGANDLTFIHDNDVDELKSITIDNLLATQHDHTESDITDLDHTDSDAIHDNVGGEINAISAKTTPVDTDIVLIEDSEDSDIAKKKLALSNLLALSHNHTESDITDLDHTDSDAIHDNVGGEINSITTKASPVAADILMIEDSEESDLVKKKITLQTIHTLLNSSGSFMSYLAALTPGFKIRPTFAYSSHDRITITPFVYHHLGTSEQIVYSDETITFVFGDTSDNSNDDNEALAGDDWYYLYLDDSAIVTVGTEEITASELVAVTTEPAWSDIKHGWYNGEDRCIGAFKTDSGNLLEFYHNGNLIMFSSLISLIYQVDYDQTFIDADLSAGLPVFSTLSKIYTYPSSGARSFYYRPNGSLNTTGITLGWTAGYDNEVFTDTSQIIEIKSTDSGSSTLNINGKGFYLPDSI